MNENTKELLAVVGAQLDRLTFPMVKNGGFVLPRDTAVSLYSLGKENSSEYQGKTGSSTESWAWTRGRQGTAGGCDSTHGSRPSGSSTPLLGPYQGDSFLEEFSKIQVAYPGAKTWADTDGFWLYAESHLLPMLNRPAGFLVGVSLTKQHVRAWAFWSAGVAGGSWIGPRHTNFPDGSICAFEPSDGTWLFGQSLVTLLDIYSVWALRHLHFEILGHWPGPQSVHLPYERIVEVSGKEHCPCGCSGRRYAECCQPADLKANRLAMAVNFVCQTAASLRSPPAVIKDFVKDRTALPGIADLI